MARAPLRDVFITGKLKERIRRDGTCYVYYPGTTTAATVYIDSSSSTTVTQPVPYLATRDALTGWVDVGEYDLSQGGKTQSVNVTAGDRFSDDFESHPFLDSSTSAQNFPYSSINSMSATTTSQLAKFVKVVPKQYIASVTKVVSASGTAIATITNSYVGLYTSDGTTLTRVGVNSTNTTSGLWDTNNTMYRQAISGTQPLYPNQTYYVGMLVNATTPGTHAGIVKVSNMPAIASTELSTPPMYTLAAQTSLPSSQAISGLTAAYDLVPWVALT